MQEGLHKIVSSEETIVAISTALGYSGIGVVRISGPEAANIAGRFFRTSISELRHKIPAVGYWFDSRGQRIDQVIVTFFRAPHSYTGEDVIEISAHGNPFSLRRIVETIRISEARLATPGEFTLRAVVHGKMDLLQAEAVREYIEAQTEQQSKTALRQMEGGVSKRLGPLKNRVVDLIARLEAGIDFAEDDVEVPSNAAVVEQIRSIQSELDTVRATFGYGKLLSTGLKLPILGKPNVGKSSLFNCLISADRSIVTEIPGTTRDVLMETVSLDGVPLRFADTAGVRETTDIVETIGVARTFETLAESDYALVVLDGSTCLDSDDRRILDKVATLPHLIVINKADLPQKIDLAGLVGRERVCVSARTRQGLDSLEGVLRAFLLKQKGDLADDVMLTNVRQYEAVSKAADALDTAGCALSDGIPHEMALLDLYGALGALNELTGEVVTEDILDRIFSTFCIGK